jgi:DNA-binding transcriptional LysR family regulator
VHVEVRDTLVDELVESLRLGELDLAYLVANANVPAGITVHREYKDDLVVISAPEHRFAQRDQVSLAEVSRESLVDFGPGTALAHRIARLFAEHDLPARVMCQASQIDFQFGLVRNGLGVAIVTRSRAAASDLPFAMLVRPRVDWGIVLATRTPRTTNPAADALLTQLMEA